MRCTNTPAIIHFDTQFKSTIPEGTLRASSLGTLSEESLGEGSFSPQIEYRHSTETELLQYYDDTTPAPSDTRSQSTLPGASEGSSASSTGVKRWQRFENKAFAKQVLADDPGARHGKSA